jgi:hypothetical protein
MFVCGIARALEFSLGVYLMESLIFRYSSGFIKLERGLQAVGTCAQRTNKLQGNYANSNNKHRPCSFVLVGIEWINVHLNTTVFSNC